MNNEMTGMWGATDLNDLIRGLKMVLAQAEDVRAQGGTLADMKSIGTCETCPAQGDTVLCEDCHECNDVHGCGEDCPDYGSYYCRTECGGNPCVVNIYEDEKEEKPTLENIAAQLQNIIADLDYLDC